jgi:DNA-binding NarL/FixJ family response regulator
MLVILILSYRMQNKSVQRKAHRVLLADSHQNILEGIRSLLETVFEVVVMVADQKSLLDSLDNISPDLVVVDLSLPITQETNVVRRLKSVKPELKIIILSVHDEQTAVEECLSAGATGFVMKSTATNDLIPAVWDVLKGRTYVSPSVNMEA